MLPIWHQLHKGQFLLKNIGVCLHKSWWVLFIDIYHQYILGFVSSQVTDHCQWLVVSVSIFFFTIFHIFMLFFFVFFFNFFFIFFLKKQNVSFFIFSCMLSDSTICYAGPLVRWSFTLYFLIFNSFLSYCSYPNDQVTSKTAPAHPHTTGGNHVSDLVFFFHSFFQNV